MDLEEGLTRKQLRHDQGEDVQQWPPSCHLATLRLLVIRFFPPLKYVGANLLETRSKVPCRSRQLLQQRVPVERPICRGRPKDIDTARRASIDRKSTRLNSSHIP